MLSHAPRQLPSWLIFDVRQMWIFAAYLLIGIVACVAVACSGEKRRGELPLAMLFDPVWPLLVLWPLWLAVVLVERSFPKEDRVSVLAVADPIGQTGVVVSALRPVGRVQIGAAHFDARSDHIIPVGAEVRVVSRSMAELVVEEEPNKAPEPTTGSVTPRARSSACDFEWRGGARVAPAPAAAHL